MGKPKKPKSSRLIKVRRRWRMNPKTKIKESAKRYLRSREREEIRKRIRNAIKKSA